MLIILFALAVIAIVLAVNLAAALIWIWAQGGALAGDNFFPRGFFVTNSALTLVMIVGGTLIETFNLRDGGDAVARMVGGRLVSPATHDRQERRLLNVVAEMALASGVACPRVYVLEREEAINAFAAGYHPDEAVVAVTRGTLSRLTRDELQGVVAHEFSHILNGDMRLNSRLIGVLFGIQMIAGFGQHLIQFGPRFARPHGGEEKGASFRLVLFALGIAMYVIGYIGIFFGRLIKSAVSRQREFLADASAVQFTRNPDGIGGALRKIGGLSLEKQLGSHINHPNAEQLSHLFLGASRPRLLSGMFATHPPLIERLLRIYGKTIGMLAAPALASEPSDKGHLPDIPYVAAGFAEAAFEAAAPIAFGRGVVERLRLAPELDSAIRNSHAASAVVFALLLEQGAAHEQKIALLKVEAPQLAELTVYLAQSIGKLPASMRLPLLDLAMPALKQLKADDRMQLLATLDKLIAADNKVTLAEFVLQTILARRLDPHAGRATSVRYASLPALKTECALLLSLVAHIAASAAGQSPVHHFLRGAAFCPELTLSAADLSADAAIGFVHIRQALDRANQLAPLAKPGLIKALVAAAGNASMLPIATADTLHAICAALEAPLPPAVEAAYAECLFADR